MLQLIRRITDDPKDSTKCYLLFANQVSVVTARLVLLCGLFLFAAL